MLYIKLEIVSSPFRTDNQEVDVVSEFGENAQNIGSVIDDQTACHRRQNVAHQISAIRTLIIGLSKNQIYFVIIF